MRQVRGGETVNEWGLMLLLLLLDEMPRHVRKIETAPSRMMVAQ